jgi:hypothetical protein
MTHRRSLGLIALGLALALPWTTASAEDTFLRKAGHWQLRMTDEPGKPPILIDVCLGKDTDARLAEFGRVQNKKMCSKSDAHRSGNDYIVDSVCDPGIGRQASTHQVTTMSGEDAYRTVAQIHYDRPLPGGKSDASSTIEGKWIGACPADMKPGDQIMKPSPDSKEVMRVNVLDAMSR